jgi:hypothetical protein
MFGCDLKSGGESGIRTQAFQRNQQFRRREWQIKPLGPHQKQTTPRVIGRLMDADFSGVITLSSSHHRANSCSSLGGVKLPKSESCDVRSPKHAGTETHQGDKFKLAHSPDRQTQSHPGQNRIQPGHVEYRTPNSRDRNAGPARQHSASPGMTRFGARNLEYMRAFAEAYPDQEFVQQVVAQVPRGHNEHGSWVTDLDYEATVLPDAPRSDSWTTTHKLAGCGTASGSSRA